MKSATHADAEHVVQIAENKLAHMSSDSGGGELGDLRVGHGDSVGEALGQAGKTGAADDTHSGHAAAQAGQESVRDVFVSHHFCSKIAKELIYVKECNLFIY